MNETAKHTHLIEHLRARARSRADLGTFTVDTFMEWAALKAWEAWEADIILNGDWSGATVRLTQEQHDALTPLQELRNAAIARAEGKS